MRQWSVMSNGFRRDQYPDPMGIDYTAFSIKELLSIDG